MPDCFWHDPRESGSPAKCQPYAGHLQRVRLAVFCQAVWLISSLDRMRSRDASSWSGIPEAALHDAESVIWSIATMESQFCPNGTAVDTLASPSEPRQPGAGVMVMPTGSLVGDGGVPLLL